MKRKPEADWTMMVFMAADNDLDNRVVRRSEAVRGLRLLNQYGSDSRVHVLAQLDRSGTRKTRRIYFRPGDQPEEVTLLRRETNCGNPNALLSFIKWGIRNFPARQYLVVMWNHGQGVLDDNAYTGGRPPRSMLKADKPPFRLIGADRIFDSSSLDYLDNRELKFVFESAARWLGRPLDLVVMDACMMGMVEIGCQLKDSVRYLVSSQEIVPVQGIPYDHVIRFLHRCPEIEAADLGRNIVDLFIRHTEADYIPTMSVFNLEKVRNGKPGLVQAVDDLSEALIEVCKRQPVRCQVKPSNNGTRRARNAVTQQARWRNRIVQARARTQHFDEPDYVDLYHFCLMLQRAFPRHRRINRACDQVKKLFGPDGFVIHSAHKGDQVGNAHGASIYFPVERVSTTYHRDNLDLLKMTQWHDFLTRFTSKNRLWDFVREYAHNPLCGVKRYYESSER